MLVVVQGSSSCCLHSLHQQRTYPSSPGFCLITAGWQIWFSELTNARGQRVRGETWTWREVHPYNTSLPSAVARQQHWDMNVLLLSPWFWMEPANSSLDRNTHLTADRSSFGLWLSWSRLSQPISRTSTCKSWFLLVGALASICADVTQLTLHLNPAPAFNLVNLKGPSRSLFGL